MYGPEYVFKEQSNKKIREICRHYMVDKRTYDGVGGPAYIIPLSFTSPMAMDRFLCLSVIQCPRQSNDRSHPKGWLERVKEILHFKCLEDYLANNKIKIKISTQ